MFAPGIRLEISGGSLRLLGADDGQDARYRIARAQPRGRPQARPAGLNLVPDRGHLRLSGFRAGPEAVYHRVACGVLAGVAPADGSAGGLTTEADRRLSHDSPPSLRAGLVRRR